MKQIVDAEWPKGPISLLSHSNIQARAFYSYALQRLPGVVRSGKPPPPLVTDVPTNSTVEPWRPFNRYEQHMRHKNFCLCSFPPFVVVIFLCVYVPRSRVYMADLESTLHFSLRVELAAHTVIKGESLVSLKKFISVLVKVKLHACIEYTQNVEIILIAWISYFSIYFRSREYLKQVPADEYLVKN